MLSFLIRKLLVALGYPRLETSRHLVGPYQHVGAIQVRVPRSTACQIFYPSSERESKHPSSSSTTTKTAPYFRPQAVQGLIDYLRFGDGLLQLLSEASHPCRWHAEPLGDEKFPLVVFSHGLAGTFEMYTELCQHMASLGYCVVALEHEDGSAAYAQSRDGRVIPYTRPNDEPYSRQKVWKLRTPMLQQRVQEMEAVIRYFQQYKTSEEKSTFTMALNNNEDGDDDQRLLEKVMRATDPSQLHLMGHSFGGATHMLAAQKWTNGSSNDDNASPQPVSLTVMDSWAFALQEDVVQQGLGGSNRPLDVLSVISEGWERNNPERQQVADFLKSSRKNPNNRILSLVAPHSVHQSFSDSEAWFPSFVARQLRNRGKGEGRHATIRGVVETWGRMNNNGKGPHPASERNKKKHASAALRPWIAVTCIILATCVFSNATPPAMAFRPSQQIRGLYPTTQQHQRVASTSTRFLSSPSTTTLYADKKSTTIKDSSSSSISVKFSNDSLVSSDNPLDQLLAWLSSDIVSIVLGSVGLLAVVVNRLALLDANSATADALTYETRADLLAVFACGSVLLNGVTKLDVTSALAESVVLEGSCLTKPETLNVTTSYDEEAKASISWALKSLLSATPAKTAVVLSRSNSEEWTVHSQAGVVPTTSAPQVPEKTPILDRVGSVGNDKETYLPTLQALPGRLEFTYLPSNTQLALLIPMSDERSSVLVLGSNTAKSFSPRDIAWSRVIAERIGEYLW